MLDKKNYNVKKISIRSNSQFTSALSCRLEYMWDVSCMYIWDVSTVQIRDIYIYTWDVQVRVYMGRVKRAG